MSSTTLFQGSFEVVHCGLMSFIPLQATAANSTYSKAQRLEEERRRINTYEKKTMSKGAAYALLAIAWTLCLSSILLSGFFVILYSMEWGADKSQAWLIAYVLSFLEGLLIVDPLKVIRLLH